MARKVYFSDDESLIMSNTGEVWVRHGPREVFGSEKAAEDFIQERKCLNPLWEIIIHLSMGFE